MMRFWRNTAGVQARLAGVFAAFLLLVVVSVLVTYRGLETQRQDARVINLAGRQRMLLQQMARLSLEVEQEGDADYRSDLSAAATSFDQTWRALRAGGALTDYTGQRLLLPAPSDPNVLRNLDTLGRGWQGLRERLEVLRNTGAGAREVEALVPVLLDQADRVVRAYEAAAEDKITQLHLIQLGFLLGGLGLLALGWWIVNASIVSPLRSIARSARLLGQGDLESPVVITGPAEIEELGAEMERTRLELLSSQRQLQEWVDTLEQRVGQRTAELEALAVVSREITSHLAIGDVLKSVTGKAQQLLGSEVAELCLLDSQGKVLRLHASAGPEAALMKGTSPVREQASGSLLQGQGARVCDADACPGFCEILNPAYRASHLAAPLRSGDRVIGVLCVGNSRRAAFRPDSVLLLTQLAGAAALALENSGLYEQMLKTATLIERQRLASEMHDGLLQTLTFLRWMARLTGEQVAEGDLALAQATLKRIDQANTQAETEIRRAISGLQEDLPVQVTLQEQIAGMVAEMGAGAEPAVNFDSHLNVPLVLPRENSEQVLRAVREALLNARRYAAARHVHVSLDRQDGEFVVIVDDDGCGFEPGSPAGDERPHFGIKIMQARANRLGGSVRVVSAPGRGTRVTLRWPVAE